MNPSLDSYYSRTEVSNSDLSWLKNQLHPREMPDPTEAYRFGNLIDAMITEPHRVNMFKRTCDSDQFTVEEWEQAKAMKHAFLMDGICRNLLSISSTQEKMTKLLDLNYKGIDFKLNMRCKWDLWMPSIGSGADIKSTAATTQLQFEDAIRYFEYDRQRAVYMTISGAKNDILIGISKVNFKIFKVYISDQSELYKSGMEKFLHLAYRWNMMFGEDKSALQQ